MKHGVLLTISLTAVLLIIALYPVIKITNSIKIGKQESEQSATDLYNTATVYLKNQNSVSTEDWKEAASSFWDKQNRVLAFVVKDQDNSVLYAKPASSIYYTHNDDILNFNYPSSTASTYKKTLPSGLVIESLFVVLTQEELYYPLRNSTFAFLAVVIVIITYLLLSSNKKVANENSIMAPQDEQNDYVEDNNITLDNIEADNSQEIENITQEDSKVSNSEESCSLYNEDEEHQSEYIPIDNCPEQEEEKTQEEPNIQKNSEIKEEPFEKQPYGLFNPETGLCWEQYLEERLNAELTRAASFEQDLSLCIASVTSEENEKSNFIKLATSATTFFSFKDMAFQLKDNFVAIILPNTDINHAIKMSEEYIRKMNNTEGFLHMEHSKGIHIGLSSRAGRLVDATRLIGEAMVSMKKAMEDGQGRILAFKPDPEKFRAYLSESEQN